MVPGPLAPQGSGSLSVPRAKCMEKINLLFWGSTSSKNRPLWFCKGFPGGASSKETSCQCRIHKRRVQSLGWKDPLEDGLAIHSSLLAWRIPRDSEAWWLWYIRLQRIGHNGSASACMDTLGFKSS